MSTSDSEPVTSQEPSGITFRQFLEEVPPGESREIADLVAETYSGGNWLVKIPEIRLHCDTPQCDGYRLFSTQAATVVNQDGSCFISYRCKNCGESWKVFSLHLQRIIATNSASPVTAEKYGERPSFGPPLPSRVWSLLGPDGGLFARGRRCENQGLGVGAFAYYRRVVENQWQRLVGEILKVARRVNAAPTAIAALESAQREAQFSRAVDELKDAIPEALRIEGHNPLTLLYTPLSEGIHSLSDEECLELATSIRVILVQLAERIGEALKDETEVRTALSRLLNRKGGG